MDSEMLAHLKSSRLLWETFVSNFSHMKVVRKPWKSFHQAWRRRIWAVSRIILYIPDICQTPQTYLCKFLPGVNFYRINAKSGILTGFTRTSGIFTDLTQKLTLFDTNTLFIMFYCVDSSCFIVLMFMVILFYYVYYADLLCLSCWAITL